MHSLKDRLVKPVMCAGAELSRHYLGTAFAPANSGSPSCIYNLSRHNSPALDAANGEQGKRITQWERRGDVDWMEEPELCEYYIHVSMLITRCCESFSG